MKRFAVALAVIGAGAFSVVGLGFVPAGAAAGGANSATVCRITGDGTTAAALHINQHAVAAFLRHGDSVPGDTVVGTGNQYVWTPDCTAVPKKVFAVAYSNMDGVAGYSPGSGDVLIAKLFDDNNDGILSVGDAVYTYKYPLTFTPAVAADFGSFQVRQHTVTGIIISSATDMDVQIDGVDGAEFFHNENEEAYFEAAPGTEAPLTIEDVAIPGAPDFLDVNAAAPSAPATPVNVAPVAHGPDDPFIDVKITP